MLIWEHADIHIENFKSAKNGIIIVVDKLQTGFDEPKLHTLFLDKEIRGINAIQTISRVNRTAKYKEECHIVDFSFENVNEKNIRDAFAEFCGISISDFDPIREKAVIEEIHRGLLAQPVYTKWFDRYRDSLSDKEANTALCLEMDADIRLWIKNMIDAHARYIQEVETRGEQADQAHADDAAKALRKAIGRYNSKLLLLQGVIEIAPNFYDAAFIDFWQRYCYIYRSMLENRSALGSISTTYDGSLGLLVAEEVEVEEPNEPDGSEPGMPTPPSWKKHVASSIVSIFDQLSRMNATEEEREQEMKFWLSQMEQLFTFFREDGKFMAMLRSPNFSREDIEKEYNKLLRRYLRQRNTTSSFGVIFVKQVIRKLRNLLMRTKKCSSKSLRRRFRYLKLHRLDLMRCPIMIIRQWRQNSNKTEPYIMSIKRLVTTLKICFWS